MSRKYSKKYIIETGTGLQDVDRLKNSDYFINESERYVNGEITLDELDDIITSYYKDRPSEEDRTEEADKVAVRISKLLSEEAFSFSVGQLMSIHKFLFGGVMRNAGKLRSYNISKEEWVLNKASVTYGDYRQLRDTLEYDFESEKNYNYEGRSIDEVINHLSIFVANLWQNHVFEEGNTRTVAVFFIMYLRSLGFDVDNEMFAKYAWYFRNALVRANYANIREGIYEDRSYLILFLRNLLLNEKNKLSNRELRLVSGGSGDAETRETRILKMMRDDPGIKINQIAKELNISRRTAETIVASLKNDGRVKRVGGRKSGYWEA